MLYAKEYDEEFLQLQPSTDHDDGCGEWRCKDEPEATPGLSRLEMKAGDTLVLTYGENVLLSGQARADIREEVCAFIPRDCFCMILEGGPNMSVIAEEGKSDER